MTGFSAFTLFFYGGKTLTIQEASSKSNVGIKELQYYEEKGLVEFQKEDCYEF